MKRLFLTSSVKSVVQDIAQKLGGEIHKPAVYITTAFMYKDKVGEPWHIENRASLVSAGFNLVDFDITGKTSQQLVDELSKYEIMYVEGGNTPYLLQRSQQNNFGEFVRQRVSQGMIYISTSAGSIITGPDISSADRPGKSAKDYGLTDTSGFDLVDFVIAPHWGDPSKREDYLHYKFPNSYKESFPHIFLTDSQYIEVNDNAYKIVDVSNNQ